MIVHNLNVHRARDLIDKVIPDWIPLEKRLSRRSMELFNWLKRDIQRNHYWKDHTYELTRSHYVVKTGPLSLKFGANAKHAKYLAFGTKRHWIEPKNAKSLSWVQNGVRRFSKGHFVSGIKARPWLRERVDGAMPKIKGEIMQEVLEFWSKK